MTLAEARVLFEIAHTAPCFADAMQAALDLDGGFVSRVLRRFEARGWVRRDRLDGDARRRTIRLLPAGRDVFAALDQRQGREVGKILARFGEADRRRLVSALDTARHLVGARGGLCAHHAVDAHDFAIRAPDLRATRIPPRGSAPAQQFRPGGAEQIVQTDR